VLAIPGTTVAPRTAPASPTQTPAPAPAAGDTGGPVSLAQLLEQLEHRRGRL
jgi:hypothetical protein